MDRLRVRELPIASYRRRGGEPARPWLSCPYRDLGARTHAIWISGVFELDGDEAWLFDCRTCDRWIVALAPDDSAPDRRP